LSTIGFCSPGTALDGAVSAAVSPDGRTAYVASAVGAVAVFDREPTHPAPSAATPPRPTLPAPSDTTKPLLRSLSLSPIRFRAAGRGPSIAVRVGARVSYTLSEPAAVRFGVERAVPGATRWRALCQAQALQPPREALHPLPTLRGGFTHRPGGPNSFRFSGRLFARKLRPGHYRLRAVAIDPAANESSAKHSRFQILGR
jgi:hypothetical protein